jgi:hypothetical protein
MNNQVEKSLQHLNSPLAGRPDGGRGEPTAAKERHESLLGGSLHAAG